MHIDQHVLKLLLRILYRFCSWQWKNTHAPNYTGMAVFLSFNGDLGDGVIACVCACVCVCFYTRKTLIKYLNFNEKNIWKYALNVLSIWLTKPMPCKLWGGDHMHSFEKMLFLKYFLSRWCITLSIFDSSCIL